MTSVGSFWLKNPVTWPVQISKTLNFPPVNILLSRQIMKVFFYGSSVTPYIQPWFPNSCFYLILDVLDIDLCSMECYFPHPSSWKVTFRVLGRGECLSMLWDLGLCKCQHSQFTYSLLIKRNLTIFERVPLPQPGIEPRTSCTKASVLLLDPLKLS